MTNFTLKRLNLIKSLFFIALFLFSSHTVFSQFYTTHYVAPAPWQYFSKANEIIIATNSTTTVNIALKKSDGTLITNLTAIKGTPAVYRFSGLPSALGVHPFNTIVNAAGLIITSDGPTSVNLRNVASDNLGSDGSDTNIKGNASLTSFGDAGIGVRYRIGYYRDGGLGNFGGFGTQYPIYTIMAINNGTTIKLNGVVLTTLNAGQSYLFQAAIGSLVESSSGTVMNTSARIDMPSGCGDGTFDQIPPEAVLGSEYFIQRGRGNSTAEQTTVVATKPNTVLTINTFSITGALTGTVTTTLINAGDFHTFINGVSGTDFTASRISATENVAVYSGTAQSCEVDISVIAPVSACGGSNFIETKKFRAYNTATSLPYFGYVLLKDASAVVDVNGVNIETLAGSRYQLGTTGWYLINFTDTQISSPDIISVSSSAKLTVSIVQQGGGFSMAGFFSNFAQQPDDPTLTYISGGGCTNNSAILSTPLGFAPYQWYFNGVAISGETSNTYTATQTGSYSVASTLVCGSQIQSKPVVVTLCTDLELVKTVDVANPCVGSNVEFTVTVTNLGPNNASGLSVNDLLPSGYTYISSIPSVGTYNSGTGIWSVGNLNNAQVITLKVLCRVNASGIYLNTASIPTGSQPDSNTANNSASVSTTPVALPTALSLTGSTICVSPGGNGTISSSTSVSGVTYQLYNSSNVVVQSAKAGTGSGLTWTLLPAGNGYYVIATVGGSCTATSATVDVIAANPVAPNAAAPTQPTCATPTGSVLLSGLPLSGTWTVTRMPGSITTSGTGTTATISNLPANATYTFTVTNASGCVSNTSANVAINAVAGLPITTGVTICQGGSSSLSSSSVCNTTTISSGPNNAGNGTNDSSIGTGAWTNTGNIINTSDTNFASQNLASNAITNYLFGTNYGFAIPAGATINGIRVVVNRQSNSNSIDDYSVRLVRAGAVVGTNLSTGAGWSRNSFGAVTYGSINNLWGTTWTPSDINASDFGVAISAISSSNQIRQLDVDYMRITVTYTVNGTINWYTASSGGMLIGSGSPFNPVGVPSSGLPNTNTAGTTTFYAECSGNPGCRTATDFVINPVSVGGTVSSSQTICSGTSPADLALAGNTGSVVKWQKSSDVAFTTPIDIAGTTTTLTGATIGNLSANTYFRAVVQSGVCATANSASVLVTAGDTTAPVIPTIADATGQCSVTPTAPTTTDACAGTITGTTATVFPITTQGTTVVTWSFNDGNGQTVTATQNVIVDDTTAPVIPTIADATGQCSVTPTAPTPTDACAGTITGTTATVFPITTQGTTVVTWSFSDGNGQTVTATQNVIVDDTTAPVIPTIADATGQCSVTPTAPTTTDACAGTITGTTATVFPITTQGTTVVTWSFNDGNGQTVTATQNVIVDDTTAPVIPTIADATGQCSVTPTAPTTTDACAGTITGTTATVFPITTQGTTVVTWSFNDGNGQTVTATQNVIVDDTTAPVIPTIADATGQCSVTPTAPTTTDACAGTITGTTATVFPITTQGTTVVTWSFNDGNGQTVTATQNVIVDDTTAPVIPTIADATGQCSVTPTAPTTTDACAGTITGTTATVFPITTQGTTVVTWSFNDGNGQTVTATQNVIVDDTTAPVIPTIADATGQCSVTPTAPTTTDACAGTITGTTATVFPITTQGTTVVTWSFSDGNGQTVTATQNVIVDDTTAPVIPTIADATGQCSVTPTAPTTTDACAGTITGTTATVFPITTQGTTVVTWSFSDGNGQTVTATQNVIVDDTTAPVIPTIADATGQCSVTPTAPTTTDACAGTITGTTATVFPITTQGTTVVTWSFNDGNGQTVTATQNVIVDDTTAPVIPTIADATGQCSVTPTAPTTTDACAGTITGTTATVFPITTQGTTVVTWSFNDGNGQTVTATQNVIVDDTTAPVIPTIADATGQCSVAPTAPTTTDACAGTITGTTATVFPITTQGTTVVTWSFNDGNGQTVTATQNVIVDDTTAPVIPTIADATGQCSVTPTAPTTTDACAGTITGTTATVFPITTQGTTVVTWSFSDGNGQTVTATQNVIVDDTTAPVIPTIADATGQCSVTPTAPTTTDACAGTITGTTATVFPITTQGTTVVTWSFNDGNGQTVTATQNVIVDDTTAPVIPTIADATGQCSVTPTAPTTTDACAGTITGTTATVFPITTQGTTVVTWSFNDGNGQTVTATQNVIVDDTTAPVIPTIADATGQCSVTPTAPTTTDACAGTITGTTATVFPITTQGTTVVTWSFNDGNGQTVTATQNVIVDDTTAPVIPTIADATGQCSVTPTAPTTTDACAGTITGTTATVFPITTQGTTVVTWSFSDGNGQTVTATQNVIVDDTTAPVIPTIADATGQCSVAPTAPTTTDACAGTITGTTATVFPITTQGTTVVTWSFNDGNGQTVTATQNVIVDDTTAPVIPTIADATGQCSVTPTAPTTTDACAGTITGTTATVFPITTQGTTVVTWSFNDGNGQTVTATQNVIVDDTTAPVIPTIADATGQCSVTPTAPTTTDACAGTITGTTATVFPITTQGTTVVTWSFNDGNGQTVTATQNVIVDDTTAPVIPTIADATGQCSVTPTAPTTTDACAGTITGTTATVFPITTQGTTVVTWSFNDGNGQTVTATQNVIIDDTTAPVIPTIADATGQCSVTPTAPTTTDACAGTITGTTATVFPITTQGTTVVTWSFNDGNGQTVTATQNVIVDDTIAPIITAAGSDATINCPATPVFTAPTATDACSSTTINVVSDVTTPGATAGVYSRTVTWDATDAAGNHSTTVSQTITVQYNTVPTITAGSSTILCSGESVVLNSDAGSAYLWSTGETTQNITVLTAGNYNVQVTNSAGCQSAVSANTTVTVNALPIVAPISGGSAFVCTGSATAAFTNVTAGGTWSVANGSGTASIDASGVVTGLSDGTVTVEYTVTNGNGCTTRVTKPLSVVSLPVVPSITGGAINACVGSGTLAFFNSLPGGTWSVANGTGTASITVDGVLTGQTAGTVTVEYTMTNVIGCAVKQSFNLTVTIPPSAGTLSGVQNICIAGNTTFTSTIGGGTWSTSDTTIATVDSTGLITGQSAGTATITYTIIGTGGCPDATVTRTVSVYSPTVYLSGNASVIENSVGTVDITASLSTITYEDVTVNLTLTGTASGLDYTASGISIVITAGSLSGNITIDPIDDIISEGNETVIANISSVIGGCASEDGTQVATVTISDDEATPTVSISSPSVTEGASASFVVSIDVPSSVDTVVNVITNTGTAGTSDYTATTTTVTIPAGQTSVTVSVPTTDDAIDEPSESFTLNGTITSGNTTNTTAFGTATINDNDATPTVSISSPSVTEGASASFVVSIDVPSSVDTVVNVITNTGTAGTSDYTATTTTVTIPAGQTSVTVSVPTTDDAIDEPSESFTLNATVTSGNTINTMATGTATINDNDATPTVSIVASISSASEPAMNGEFIIALTNPIGTDTEVKYTITGTASNGIDFGSITNAIIIPANTTSVKIPVTVTDDNVFEGSETVVITLVSANNFVTVTTTSADAVATVTIGDDEVLSPAPPTIFANDDNIGSITSVNGIQTILNVLSNDRLDLNNATLANVTLSVVTADPTGFISLKADGSIELAANTPAGIYTLAYSICDVAHATNCDTATVTVTVICNSSTAISGIIRNEGTNTPLANVPVTLKPINSITGPVLLSLTKVDGSYAFSGMIPGDYVLQVQDANLNAAQELFNTTPSFLILKVEDCKYQKIDFGYDKTDLLVLGDFVWYDINNNGIQDEWYDANNDGLVTQNLPDVNGVVDYSKWEWIDFNGDGSYKGKENAGELNAAGFGNGTTNTPNIFVTGPNGFSRSVTMGVEGYWRTRAPKDAYGEYKIEFIKEANFEMASEAMSASGLVKVLPSVTLKQVNTSKSKSYVDCGLTTNNILFAQFSATEKVHLDLDFGISCKLYSDLLANNDDAGTVDGLKASNGIFNAIANDTFNGLPINLSDVVLTFTPSPNFTMGTNGLLNTLSNIPGGTYTLTYSICEKANPSNCSTATVTVFVSTPSIALVKTAHFNDENADGYGQAGETITYSFEVTNTGNVPLMNVTITDPLPGVVMTGIPLTLAIGETNTTHFQGVYAIKQTDINVGSISNQATVYGTSPNNRVVEDKSDDINIVNDNPTVLTVSGCAIKVYNAVTPDGSGKYDKLVIEGLECYPDNSIEIFNRWGVLVFEREHYNNDDIVFRGISEGRVTVEKSQELPTGTYFYILKYKDSESNTFEKTGYLYLNRK